MDIYIQLTTTEADQGALFDLYSDVDGFTSIFDSNVNLASLQSGYTTTTAPAGTNVVRVCGQQIMCPNCLDIVPYYTTTTSTTLPPVECNQITNSGGVGVTEYSIPLETAGGLLVLDFQAYGVPDKLEIIHNGIKVATSGMTVANAGPFDNLYGDPTVPTPTEVLAIDQFIGTQKDIPPTREAEIFADTGKTYIVSGQQLIWWAYTDTDVLDFPNATVRITGPSGTAWQMLRLCEENTTTTTTTSTSSTTTTTTTAVPTTTTTTTQAPGVLKKYDISTTTTLTDDCGLILDDLVYVEEQNAGLLTAGDKVFTNSGGTSVFVGNGDYYHIEQFGGGSGYSARISAFGIVLGPIALCP